MVPKFSILSTFTALALLVSSPSDERSGQSRTVKSSVSVVADSRRPD
jgi:hypothetical protein